MLLDVPPDVGQILHAWLAGSGDADVQVTFDPDGRTAKVKVNEIELPASFAGLPTVVETHKSVDDINFFKTGEVGQVLIARHQEAELPPVWRWRNVGSKEPMGVELINERLAKALEQKTEFAPSEWDAFGIKNLRAEHFIKVNDSYFQLAAAAELPGGLTPPTQAIRKKLWRKRPVRDPAEVERVAVELEKLRGGSLKPEVELKKVDKIVWVEEDDPDQTAPMLEARTSQQESASSTRPAEAPSATSSKGAPGQGQQLPPPQQQPSTVISLRLPNKQQGGQQPGGGGQGGAQGSQRGQQQGQPPPPTTIRLPASQPAQSTTIRLPSQPPPPQQQRQPQQPPAPAAAQGAGSGAGRSFSGGGAPLQQQQQQQASHAQLPAAPPAAPPPRQPPTAEQQMAAAAARNEIARLDGQIANLRTNLQKFTNFTQKQMMQQKIDVLVRQREAEQRKLQALP